MTDPKKELSFGALAVKMLYTTQERVNECVDIQDKIRAFGVTPKKLGEILIEKGYLVDKQVQSIFRVQGSQGGIHELPGYQIMETLGQGAMGTVYKALQLSMGRSVAIKVLSPQLSEDEKFVKRFFKEARMSAWLNHPNIVQGIDVCVYNGLYFFVMEYVDGLTLEQLVKEQGPMPEQRILPIMFQAAQALEHAYKYDLIHRDIKARNILIGGEDKVKLCDLGLAQIAVSEAADSATAKRILSGTPAYVSPEQAQGRDDLDIRTDIYSLGVTFYFCVVGDLPFHGDTLEVIEKHIKEQPVPARARNPRISITTNTIISKMMAKQREYRYQTPAELIHDLDIALSGRPLPPPPQSAANRLRMSPRLAKATALARFKLRKFRR